MAWSSPTESPHGHRVPHPRAAWSLPPTQRSRESSPSASNASSASPWKRSKQCGRSQLPVIETPKPFEALARPDAMVLTPGAPPLDSSEKLSTNPVVLVGPEGGWSAPELHLAQDRELTVFGLGPRTMRTETAAIAAATLMQWLGGDLR